RQDQGGFFSSRASFLGNPRLGRESLYDADIVQGELVRSVFKGDDQEVDAPHVFQVEGRQHVTPAGARRLPNGLVEGVVDVLRPAGSQAHRGDLLPRPAFARLNGKAHAQIFVVGVVEVDQQALYLRPVAHVLGQHPLDHGAPVAAWGRFQVAVEPKAAFAYGGRLAGQNKA